MNPNPPPPPPFAAEPPSTWWSRNKKWAIPVGCVGLVVILGCCGLLGAAMFGFGKVAKYAQEQSVALAAIRTESAALIDANPEIKELVGEPLSIGAPQSPNWKNINGKVDYRFQIPVTGPKGEVLVHGHATAPDGDTPLKLRSLEFDNGERNIELLPE